MFSQNSRPLKTILVTGASGFIGRAFLHAAREHYHIFALARRSQTQAGVPEHPNIDWIMADITDLPGLREAFTTIRDQGGAKYVLHLAGYYSFENTEEPEYELTNVQGTENVLECCSELDLDRFVFASSLVISEFPAEGELITEASEPNAPFPYARSKRKGEVLTRAFSEQFPCSAVRLAATFSDWCEYGPFYKLLTTWLSGKWNSRILAGRGLAAQPFVHIDHVVGVFLSLFEHSAELPRFDLYLVSSRETYSHLELYEIATRLRFGKTPAPIFAPKPFATLAVIARDIWGRLTGHRPFERLWMMKYVDRQIRADDSYTRRKLGVTYKPRLSLRRRFPYMLENISSNTVEWHARNAAILEPKHMRRSMVIASVMLAKKKELLAEILRRIVDASMANRLPHHNKMDTQDLRWNVELIYNLLMSSVQYGDRMSLLSYARYLAYVRKREGVDFAELRHLLALSEETVLEPLRGDPRLKDMEQALIDSLRLTTELAIDEIEAVYESEEEPPALGSYHVLRDVDGWPNMTRTHFLQSVIDSIDDSLIIVDKTYRVRMMNRHAHELHVGLVPAKSPLHCYEISHARENPCSGKEHPCPLEEVFRTGSAMRVRHTHFDRLGKAFEVDLLASPLMNDEGTIIGIIETTHEASK